MHEGFINSRAGDEVNAQENIASRSDNTALVEVIWGEKREKNVGGKEPESLYINISDPNISINFLSQRIFTAIKSLSPETAYNWAWNWGRTRVALSFNDFTVDYLHTDSAEAKKRIILHTDRLILPQSRLVEVPSNKRYFTAITNEPSTIEGLILQVERMTDELIWCLSLKYKESIKDPIQAYQLALEELGREGYDIYVLDTQHILNLRRNDDRYAVRIYGNFLGEGKVTEIIGTVGPLENCEKPPCLQGVDFPVLTCQNDNSTERHVLREGVVLNMGICILKRPHVGHMLLAGVLDIAKRSLGEDVPTVIQANDTGVRIIETISRISDKEGISPSEAITMMFSGKMTSERIERYYQNRNLAKRGTIAKVTDLIKQKRGLVASQAREYLSIFESFLGYSPTLILESDVPPDYSPHKKLNDKKWEGYGVSYAQINKRNYMLQSNGLLTASATRAAATSYTATLLNANTQVYIDGDRSITDAITILKEYTDIKSIQYNGAAVGFNFKVCSGTDGTSVLMKDFMSLYRTRYGNRSLLDDIVFLISTRYQLKSPNELPFFDYANPEAMINDLQIIQAEREELVSRTQKVMRRISDLTDAKAVRIKYDVGDKKAKRLDYLISRVCNLNFNEPGDPGIVFLKPLELAETPEVQSLIDRTIVTEKVSREAATQMILTRIIESRLKIESNTVNKLRKHGYVGAGLLAAVTKFANEGFQLVRINSLLSQAHEDIDLIVSHAVIIDAGTAGLLINQYRLILKKLFNIHI